MGRNFRDSFSYIFRYITTNRLLLNLCYSSEVVRSSCTMAGIVASTLRRKAFHRGGTRSSEQNKVALAAAAAAAAAVATDGSPSASRRSSRSSSFTGCRPDDDDDRSASATQTGQVQGLTPSSTIANSEVRYPLSWLLNVFND